MNVQPLFHILLDNNGQQTTWCGYHGPNLYGGYYIRNVAGILYAAHNINCETCMLLAWSEHIIRYDGKVHDLINFFTKESITTYEDIKRYRNRDIPRE